MKLWRKEAREHNREAGMKHQGRKNKLPNGFTSFATTSRLLSALFKRAGIGGA